MQCEMCSGEVEQGDAYFEIKFHHPEGRVDETYLGSMGCYIQWAVALAAHYMIEHLDDEEIGGDPSLN